MGLHDRHYWREEGSPGDYGGGFRGRGVFAGMPRPTSAVKWLLIANIVVFVLKLVGGVVEVMAVVPEFWWQPWRYVTFQFLHVVPIHLLFNMIGLYFLGMVLERAWGARRFLKFYLSCGAFAGLCHVLLTVAFSDDPSAMNVPLLGASGGVYAIVLACAVLFPHIRLVLLLFLVPIRFVALLFIGLAAYRVLSSIVGDNPFTSGISDAAHLGGAAAAAFYIWILPRLRAAPSRRRARINQGAWRRKLQRRSEQQDQVDRILDKIRRDGINSLSAREKKILRQATRRRQDEEQDVAR